MKITIELDNVEIQAVANALMELRLKKMASQAEVAKCIVDRVDKIVAALISLYKVKPK